MRNRHDDQETQYPSIIFLQKAAVSSKGPARSENSGSVFTQPRTDPAMGATSGVAEVAADASSTRTSVLMPPTSTSELSRRNQSTVRAPSTVAPSVTEAILPIVGRRDSSNILQLKGEHFFYSSIPLHQAVSLNSHNPHGVTPFDNTEVQQIINEGKVDVDFRSPRFGLTPLDIAACCGYTHSAKMILASNPAAVHSRDEFGIGPVERAKQNGHDSLARLLQELLDQSDPPSQAGESAELLYPEKFPLHTAALMNDVEAITRILESKEINVDCLDSLGCSPLHIAASVGTEEAARKLIIEGRASTKLRDNWGLTAKEEAQKQGHHKVAQAIKEVAQEQFFPRMVEKSLGIFGVKF